MRLLARSGLRAKARGLPRHLSVSATFVNIKQHPACCVAILGAHPHLIAMMPTIDDYMQALERAWDRATPSRAVVERDYVQRELRRQLEQSDCAPPRVPLRLRLVRA